MSLDNFSTIEAALEFDNEEDLFLVESEHFLYTIREDSDRCNKDDIDHEDTHYYNLPGTKKRKRGYY